MITASPQVCFLLLLAHSYLGDSAGVFRHEKRLCSSAGAKASVFVRPATEAETELNVLQAEWPSHRLQCSSRLEGGTHAVSKCLESGTALKTPLVHRAEVTGASAV